MSNGETKSTKPDETLHWLLQHENQREGGNDKFTKLGTAGEQGGEPNASKGQL